MKKIIVLMLLATFALVGCSHGTEIKQRGIVEGIYIDSLEDGGFLVVLEILDSTVDKTRMRKFESAKGDNINEILLDLENNTATELFYENVSIIVLDLKTRQSDILDIVFSFIDNSDFNKGAKILFCEFEEEYLEESIVNETMISSEINSLVDNLSNEGMTVGSSLIEIEIDSRNFGFFKSNIITLGEGVDFDGICYFTNYKTINLSSEEALYHGIITGEIKEFEIVLNDEVYEVFGVNINYFSKKTENTLVITINISGYARAETEDGDINTFVKSEVQSLYDKLSKNGIDFLNFESSFEFYQLEYSYENIEIQSEITINEVKKQLSY